MKDIKETILIVIFGILHIGMIMYASCSKDFIIVSLWCGEILLAIIGIYFGKDKKINEKKGDDEDA